MPLHARSSIQSRSLDSALKADPYFAQKLKMQMYQDKYSKQKQEYLNRKKNSSQSSRKLYIASQKIKRKSSPKNNSTMEYNSTTQWRKPPSHKVFRHRAKLLGFGVKYDVRFDGMNPKWYQMLPKIRNAFGTFKPTITSGTDGKYHQRGKYSHYTGYKIDIRVKNMPGVRIRKRKVIAGREVLMQYIYRLNKISGIKAVLEEGRQYPHIDILVEY